VKNFDFAQYNSLLKALFADKFFTFGKRFYGVSKKNDGKSGAGRGKKAVSGVFTGLFIVFMLLYLVSMVVTITLSAIDNGMHEKVPYFIIAAAQFVILFLGTSASFDYLYFGADNQLLESLPVSSTVVFSVKFTLTYLAQLIIAFAVILPSLIAYGVVCGAKGINLGVGFYFYAVFTPLLAPAIPLLAVSLLSIPVMYLMSFAKNRQVAKTVLSILLTIGFLIFYFIMIFVYTNISTAGAETAAAGGQNAFSALDTFVSAGILNYNWVEAMLGHSAVSNTLFYLLAIIGAFVLTLVMVRFTYKRSLSFSLESGTAARAGKKRRGVAENFKKSNFFKAFFYKDLKVIFSEPTLFLSLGISAVAVPLITAVIARLNIFDFSETGVVSYTSELSELGFIFYMVIIIMCGSNTISLVGFSLEGKNMAVLKSLPVSPKDIVKSKLLVSNIYNVLVSLEFFIAYAAAGRMKLDPLIALIGAALLFAAGFGVSCYGLYSDMKNPKLGFDSLQELTKNNTRTIRPMMFAIGFGLIFLVAGILLGIFLDGKPLTAYAAFFAIFAAAIAVFDFFTFSKLHKNAEELFDRLEA
jgi:ABC-2 type transport system permease protein